MRNFRLHSHAHAAHAAAHAAHAAAFAFFVGDVGNHRFGGEHQAGNRSRVLQSVARHFRRVNHARRDQIFKFFGRRVEAEVFVVFGADFFDDDRAFFTGVAGNLAKRFFDGALDDVDADLLVGVAAFFGRV